MNKSQKHWDEKQRSLAIIGNQREPRYDFMWTFEMSLKTSE
jgi:hypothetical protein